MNSPGNIFRNPILVCAACSWLTAQVLKTIIHFLLERKWDWKRLIGMGGMPSAHTAFVFSLAMMTGIREGFSSAPFAIAFALMVVVVYDAMGVRAETGKQGAVLNRILKEVLVKGKRISEDNLKELVGHTPMEVCGGIVVGLLMVIVMANVLP